MDNFSPPYHVLYVYIPCVWLWVCKIWMNTAFIDRSSYSFRTAITVTPHEHHGVPNHLQIDRLWHQLFNVTTTTKTKKSKSTLLAIHEWYTLVVGVFPHKEPVMWKAFPCHDVIVISGKDELLIHFFVHKIYLQKRHIDMGNPSTLFSHWNLNLALLRPRVISSSRQNVFKFKIISGQRMKGEPCLSVKSGH